MEDVIREAVFRHMFNRETQQHMEHAKRFFISLAGQDPDDAFISRFDDVKLPVKKGSQSMTTGGMGMVADKETGELGIHYKIGRIDWISESEADVEVSFHAANLATGGCTYRVVGAGSKWVVEGCKGSAWRA
jgi:hypothetical protein